MSTIELSAIGVVESPLTERSQAPRQADEAAPGAVLAFTPTVQDGLKNLKAGDEVLLLTWLHRADRTVLCVHPRGDASRPLEGVFSTRSQDRPNPLGLHRVTITAIEENRLHVGQLDALDGTPILDVKAILSDDPDLR